MRTSELKQLCAMTRRLPPSQREELMAHLTESVARDEVEVVIDGEQARRPGCPECGGQHTVRNGQASSLQRCNCRGCGVTFNASTGTPLARLRRRGNWLEQGQAMDERLSVRKSAARMAVHRTTAFRLRHRFLALPLEAKAQQLSGVAEGDETSLLRSYNGQRRCLLARMFHRPSVRRECLMQDE